MNVLNKICLALGWKETYIWSRILIDAMICGWRYVIACDVFCMIVQNLIMTGEFLMLIVRVKNNERCENGEDAQGEDVSRIDHLWEFWIEMFCQFFFIFITTFCYVKMIRDCVILWWSLFIAVSVNDKRILMFISQILFTLCFYARKLNVLHNHCESVLPFIFVHSHAKNIWSSFDDSHNVNAIKISVFSFR